MERRGEGWVILQLVLILIVLFMPRLYQISFPFWLRMLGAIILIAAGAAVVVSIRSLGRSVTPFPKPVPGGQLVTSGIYGIVRHPIYSAAIFATLGWALLTSNILDICMVAVVFLFVDMKSRREEQWLIEAYSDYSIYRKRVKKLIPWIY